MIRPARGAFAQVKNANGQGFNIVKSMLEIVDGAVREPDDGDKLRLLSGRMTMAEYSKALALGQQQDEGNDDSLYPAEHAAKLDEDLWHIYRGGFEGPR